MKEKTLKFRLSEESANDLEKIASETGTTKSEVLRNGIPKKLSLQMFNDLLSFHNLKYLENEAIKCVASFEKGIAIELQDIKNQYPAYTDSEDDDIYLLVKFPTIQLNVNEPIGQEQLKKMLLDYKMVQVYSNRVVINMKEFTWRESILCLASDLKSNYSLAESITKTLSDKGLSVTTTSHYYLKSYKLKTDKAKQYALGIIEN